MFHSLEKRNQMMIPLFFIISPSHHMQ